MRVSCVNVYVSDFGQAADFYTQILGLTVSFRDDRFGYLRLDAPPVQIGIAAVAAGATNGSDLVGRHTGIGFAVPDLDAAYERLQEQGVRFSIPPVRAALGPANGDVLRSGRKRILP